MKLPVPRLQIVWEYVPENERDYDNERIATYELVLYEGKESLSDIRANDDDGPSENPVKVEMGKTKVSGGGGIMRDGVIETPFRDGVHIMRDSIRLGDLPMYVIYGDQAQEIEQQIVECDGQVINKSLLETA